MSRAISILICALGGEGGGVLASWLTNAAVEASLPVQRTSIPGVAQRTGATTYYLEIFPIPRIELAEQEPVLGLHAAEGGVDIIVATELLEASRALHRGYATRNRTLLIASTHRVYTISEKASAIHGRFNERTAFDAIAALTREAIQFDAQAAAVASRSHINAVLLGAIAVAGGLPIPEEIFRAALRKEGKLVEENLRGFDAGMRAARVFVRAAEVAAEKQWQDSTLIAEVRAAFPVAVWPIMREAIVRLMDYQDRDYGQLYLRRLIPIRNLDSSPFDLLATVARQLALWMCYEDVIRVAQLKTRPTRMLRIRATHGALAEQPVTVVDYLKPGTAELCSLLPPWAGRRLVKRRYAISLKVRTSSVLGFVQMRILALLRRWRPYSYGFKEEQHLIEEWLGRVSVAAKRDLLFAEEIAQCAKLVRGYGDTRQRGHMRLRRIYETVIDAPLAKPQHPEAAIGVRRARMAALVDDTGVALERELETLRERRAGG